MILKILDWSEVWATLLPIFVLFFKKQCPLLTPVIAYLWTALMINILCDLAYIKVFTDNNFLYNLHSIIRLFLLLYFFALLKIPSSKKIRIYLFIGALLLITVNFIFLESFKNFSSHTFTLEGIILLACCISYFLKTLKSEEASTKFDSALIIVTGLAVYEAICFFIFLFYDQLNQKAQTFAIDIWNVHNIAYIVFCLFIARAFYGTHRV